MLNQIPRLRTEQIQAQTLHPNAQLVTDSAGRAKPEERCAFRTDYQRDVDRITHSKAFRRLMYKTQVFLCPEGDHYRTRLTHAMEVSRIARTVARGVGLNEDLTEAVALGHDLGHAPYGHAGERALNEVVPGGFSHNLQSRRMVESLERGGLGLNLTAETLDGIECHSGEKKAQTLEGDVVRIADRIAYINHDFDDAVRAGLLTEAVLSENVRTVLGESYSGRIDTLVCDMVRTSLAEGRVAMTEPVAAAMEELRRFMFTNVYLNPAAKSEETKAMDIIKRLYAHFSQNPDRLPCELRPLIERDGTARAAADYIAGMTDRFARERAEELFLPRGWEKH